MMKIDLFLIPASLDPSDPDFKDRPAVVIDVLRASTTMIAALEHGCRIIPTDTPENAKKLAVSMGGGDDVLLCGERKGQLIEGFHIGNSPADYTRDLVGKKTLIYTTTNGTQAILRCKGAEPLYICGFPNVQALARHLVETTSYFFVLCSGNYGQISLEDVVCAGMLVDEVQKIDPDVELKDSGVTALGLYHTYQHDLLKMVEKATHGRYLREIGLGDDLPLCVQTGTSQIIPIYAEGRITAHHADAPE